ncbi:class I SAM-dependent methyltransferase, partial [Micromonospora sp. NPDC003197]
MPGVVAVVWGVRGVVDLPELFDPAGASGGVAAVLAGCGDRSVHVYGLERGSMTAVALRQVFDSDEQGGRRVLDYLSAVLDGFTCDRLGRVGVAWGGRCWVVGAGNGSVAGWLGDRIGPTGEVIATGLCPDLVRSHPRVTVIGRNDERDPLLGGVFDLVHARLVFAGWPQRWELVHRYARALGPGKPLVIEDWGRWSGQVLSSPVPDAAGVYCRFR